MTHSSAPLPNARVLIIGAGFIARHYVVALLEMGIENITVLTRGETRAREISAQFQHSISVHHGGIKNLPALLNDADAVIIATSIEAIPEYAEVLARTSHPRVLLEKPSFLSSGQLVDFLTRHPQWPAAIALNRLFYPSVCHLREKLAHSVITSAQFSFTEWTHLIKPSDYSSAVLARWGISNCIHVLATVFDLIGLPESLNAEVQGKDRITWHPSGSLFCGSGVSLKQVPFSYHSDWTSSGRWSIVIHTSEGAYTLAPMEALSFTPRGRLDAEIIVPTWSGATKCGFKEMLEGFLSGTNVIRLPELVPHLQSIEQIFRYDNDIG